jgi:hypothetical protein
MRQTHEDDSLSQEELLRNAAYAPDLHKALSDDSAPLITTAGIQDKRLPKRKHFHSFPANRPDLCFQARATYEEIT